MSYGYYPELVPAHRFQQQFEAEIMGCVQILGVSDLLNEIELRQILKFLNQNRPFQANGVFNGFLASSLRQAQLDILHRLYSVWWAEQMRQIDEDERQKIVDALRVQLVAAAARDWGALNKPMAFSFSTS